MLGFGAAYIRDLTVSHIAWQRYPRTAIEQLMFETCWEVGNPLGLFNWRICFFTVATLWRWNMYTCNEYIEHNLSHLSTSPHVFTRRITPFAVIEGLIDSSKKKWTKVLGQSGAVITWFNRIFYAVLQWLMQNINRSLYVQNTPHISSSRASYRCLLWESWRKLTVL